MWTWDWFRVKLQEFRVLNVVWFLLGQMCGWFCSHVTQLAMVSITVSHWNIFHSRRKAVPIPILSAISDRPRHLVLPYLAEIPESWWPEHLSPDRQLTPFIAFSLCFSLGNPENSGGKEWGGGGEESCVLAVSQIRRGRETWLAGPWCKLLPRSSWGMGHVRAVSSVCHCWMTYISFSEWVLLAGQEKVSWTICVLARSAGREWSRRWQLLIPCPPSIRIAPGLDAFVLRRVRASQHIGLGHPLMHSSACICADDATSLELARSTSRGNQGLCLSQIFSVIWTK